MKPSVDLDAKIEPKDSLGQKSQPIGAYAGLIFVTLIFAGSWLLGMKRQSTNVNFGVRVEFLTDVKETLAKHGVESELVPNDGLLRISTKNVLFPVGVSFVPSEQNRAVDVVAAVLEKALSCTPSTPASIAVKNALAAFDLSQCDTANPAPASIDFFCKDSFRALDLSSVLVQGHADMRPLVGHKNYKDNLELSAARSQSLLRRFYGCTPALKIRYNTQGLPLFNTAAYATQRPAVLQDGLSDENRRMELQFIVRGL